MGRLHLVACFRFKFNHNVILHSFKSFKALKYKIIVLLLLLTHLGFGQSIGVRAGWNFNTISGPLETNESYGYTNGIHFGINYGYKLSHTFYDQGRIVVQPNRRKTEI